jgi:hypothetical protein
VTLVWAVPVVAAAVATVLVVAWARAIEDEATGLLAAVRRLREIAGPLAAVRDVVRETDEVTATFRERHRPDGDPDP